jgi:hypothetical protein
MARPAEKGGPTIIRLPKPFGTVQASSGESLLLISPLPNSPIHHDDLEPSLLKCLSRAFQRGYYCNRCLNAAVEWRARKEVRCYGEVRLIAASLPLAVDALRNIPRDR